MKRIIAPLLLFCFLFTGLLAVRADYPQNSIAALSLVGASSQGQNSALDYPQDQPDFSIHVPSENNYELSQTQLKEFSQLTETLYSSTSDLPTPSWWDGPCNNKNHPGSYSRGSYRNVDVCGPNYKDDPYGNRSVQFFSGAHTELEWQCVEFVMRYMYLAYGIKPYPANADEVYKSFPDNDATLRKIPNGTQNDPPKPGDIISYYLKYWDKASNSYQVWRHTALVIESSVGDDGNGYIYTLNQNWSSSTPKSKVTVTGWNVQDAVGWLRDRTLDEPPATGAVTSPAANAMISGTVAIAGWSKAGNLPVDHVEILVDGTYRGNATYGLPNAEAGGNYGFSWDMDTTSTIYNEGPHILQAKGVMRSGAFSWLPINGTGGQSSATIVIDNLGPERPSFVSPNCQAKNDIWQNTCQDPSFTWSVPDDPGVGVASYRIYWGSDPLGDPNIDLNSTAFDPPSVVDGAVTYLRLQSKNYNGRWSQPETIFTLRYDGTPPQANVLINGGDSKTTTVNVTVSIDATDSSSGVYQTRISNYPTVWIDDWKDFSPTQNWSIMPIRSAPLSVFVEVTDHAGNLMIVSDTIEYDPAQPLPYSANYRLCGSSLNLSGGTLTGGNYQLAYSLGQAASGHNTSKGYIQQAGILDDASACWMPVADQTGYSLEQSVIASSGGLRSSTQYRMGDTFGQALSTGDKPITGATHQLQSGYWGNFNKTIPSFIVSGVILPTPVIPLNPTPRPTATPAPDAYTVLINEGAAYTNGQILRLKLQAPFASAVRLSNDPLYADDNWIPYQTQFSWTARLALPEDEAQFTRVYAWFKNLDGVVLGPYYDQILFDKVPPYGYIYWDDSGAATPVLRLDATDVGSGVEMARVGYSADLSDATWFPVSDSFSADASRNTVYAQFKDRAGNVSEIMSTFLYMDDSLKTYIPYISKK